MRLFNTLTGKVERLRPPAERPFFVYCCGITPYDTTHLGHAFTYVAYDTLIRHLEVVHGKRVRYVQNLTDIDDDILKAAAKAGEGWRDLGLRWTARFIDDMRRLNLRPPDAFPAASGVVDDIQRLTAELVSRRLAYVADGNVYLSADKAAGFGRRLVELDAAEMLRIANERGNHPDDPHKLDRLDPVLWQAAAPGEPAWESVWGPGRPGWHVECAAMAMRFLGPQIDVHGGGSDLQFPHHEAEIVLAEPVTGVAPFSRIWMHVAMVEMNGEKMSKSLGNLVLVDDLLRDEHPDTLRLYLLRHHYRERWAWNPEELEETRAWTRTLHGAMSRRSGLGIELDPAPYGPRFTQSLDADLDTPEAVRTVLRLADDILEARADANVAAAQDVLRTIAGRVLGLWLDDPQSDAPAASAWPAPVVSEPDISVFVAPS